MTTEHGTGKAKGQGGGNLVEHVPFLLLGLDLPAAPLFKDALEKNIIPQASHGRQAQGVADESCWQASCHRQDGRGWRVSRRADMPCA